MFREYKEFWNGYLDYSGRARRREYWVPYLINLGIIYALIGISLIISMAGINISAVGSPHFNWLLIAMGIIIAILTLIFLIIVIIGDISLSVRRCHDLGYHGYVFLFCMLGTLVCGIGGIVWLVFTFLDSAEDNEWGANPKKPMINTYSDEKGIWMGLGIVVIGFALYCISGLLSGLVIIRKITEFLHTIS